MRVNLQIQFITDSPSTVVPVKLYDLATVTKVGGACAEFHYHNADLTLQSRRC